MSRRDRFLRACRGDEVDATPIWLMRQAGRYMEAYRNLRKRYSITEIIESPDLATEVTLQPIEAFNVDAGIIFSDILPPLNAMGLRVEFREHGPVIDNPIRTASDVQALATPEPEAALDFTLQAIRQVVATLNGKVPIIGFAGAPFTLASYAIEGGGSRQYAHTKGLLYNDPAAWESLMTKLSHLIGTYLVAQIEAGAKAVQLFDSWVGALSPYDYQNAVLPHVRRVVSTVKAAAPDTPFIYFATGANGFLPLLADSGCDILSVDWRIEIGDAMAALDNRIGLQGNLDPLLLCGPHATMFHQTARILDATRNKPRFIFNLGHGVLKHTPPENVAALVDYVHSYSQR